RGSRRLPWPALRTIARNAAAPSGSVHPAVAPGCPGVLASVLWRGDQKIVQRPGRQHPDIPSVVPGGPATAAAALPADAPAMPLPGPRRRRPGRTLYRYLASEALRPTAFALVGLTVVVLTTEVLHFSELVINRGVNAGSVARILFFEAVPMAARMLPFSVLVGALF